MNGLPRRPLVVAALLAPLAARSRPPGAAVLLMRHALTEPGVGDPPGFALGRCETQRNLSTEGRAQARTFGARLAALGLRPQAIRSSRWCRCLHTGQEIAAGLGGVALSVEPWPALDSTFGQPERGPAQDMALRERLAARRGARTFELWVSHQVNISALTGTPTSMGQALWLALRADGSLSAEPFS